MVGVVRVDSVRLEFADHVRQPAPERLVLLDDGCSDQDVGVKRGDRTCR
jgi:hypothetical protein